MRTVRRILHREIALSVAFVGIAFLALFFFIDFVDELDKVGKRGYRLVDAAWACLLEVPGHVYELLPIAVLIGSIYALARLAQSSEYTILRTAGLGPGRALGLLASLGLAFTVLTFVVGDFIAPLSETAATVHQARFKGGIALGRNGAWMRDSRVLDDGEHRYSVNVGAAPEPQRFADVRIFEFGPRGELRSRVQAAQARVQGDGRWLLEDVRRITWTHDAQGVTVSAQETLPRLEWESSLGADVVAAAMLPLRTMSTRGLFAYMNHLSEHDQAAQRYEIQFWKKALYPFACLVMVALALPFAYLHARGGGVSLMVFGGIMLGISFVLLNNVMSHLGLLRDWTPWVAASLPSVIYLLLSLAAFGWLVRHR